jgi:steroid delta-isomerase-like uncharacterized protein
MKKLFMILPLALIICFMVSCQNQEAIAELEAMKAQAEIEEQNKALLKSLVEELNKGSLEFFNESYAPDFLFYSPSNNPKPMSLEETQEFMKMLLKAFPDINLSIEDLFAVEDRIIVRYIIRGTHEGELQGIPATGSKIEFSSTILITIKDGKVVEEREDVDMLGFMQQLGMELKPKEGEK